VFVLEPVMSKKTDNKFKQYFVAIVPPSPFYEQAKELKVYFKDQYQSKASLNSPPHITLHMPFKWKEEKEEEIASALSDFSSQHSLFSLKLQNFSCFPPKVIFIDVDRNEEIAHLQKELYRFCKRKLNLFNADYKDLPFHPHLTLAFRDLKKRNFELAWEEFKEKEFEACFDVRKIVLLKHTGRVWKEYRDFDLN
jgi:2'-5' RNA ligase